MDFAELLKPYSENGRTPAGQRKWLAGKGVSPDKIDKAMLVVYDELSRGKTFQDGHELDRYLWDVAKKIDAEHHEAEVKRLEEFFQKFKERWEEERVGMLEGELKGKWEEEFRVRLQTELANAIKPGFWKRLKAVVRP